MKLEQQVCSLDLAKKLRELGVKRESAFYWGWFLGHLPDGADGKGILYFADNHDIPELAVECIASAFTVAELGEMLPKNVPSWNNSVSRGQETWICQDDYNEYDDGVYPHSETGATEADARAKMLIYLIEKGIVKL